MSKRASPAVVGAFVLAAAVLLVAAIVVLGSGRFFHETTRLMVYFDGSVGGLRVGAPVKFRGIDIGSVQDIRINMRGAVRDPENVRIPVVLEIDHDRLTSRGVTNLDLDDRAQMKSMVDRGLRAELATESLVTGLRYVSLDVKPHTPIRMMADPDDPYPEIPSVRSAMEQLPDKVDLILGKVAELDVTSINRSIESTAADAHRLLASPDLMRAIAGLDELTANLNRTVARLDTTVRSLEPATAELGRAATSARQLIAPEGPLVSQLDATLKELRAAGRSVHRLADQLARDPGSIVRGGRP
jgi:paraquat-inducible protein B